jgi:hypothetical protein
MICLSFCPLSFGHFFVSVLLQFTASYFPFGIFTDFLIYVGVQPQPRDPVVPAPQVAPIVLI